MDYCDLCNRYRALAPVRLTRAGRSASFRLCPDCRATRVVGLRRLGTRHEQILDHCYPAGFDD